MAFVKKNIAVALEYPENYSRAPTVVATGERLRADELVSIARRYGIQTVEESTLASELVDSEVDLPVPGRLYKLVARALLKRPKQRPLA